MATTARTGPDTSQELCPSLPCEFQGPRYLGHIKLLPQELWQEAGSEAKSLRLE